MRAELVQLRVDVIVADTAGEVTAAKNATATIPIVMRGVADPIALGLVASLAHPGGNITGVAALAPELSGKRLELLKEVIPKLSRVALLITPVRAWRTSIKETELAAQALGLQFQVLQVRGVDELEGMFDAAKKQRAEALVQVKPPRWCLTNHASSNSPPKTDCRQCTIVEIALRLVG